MPTAHVGDFLHGPAPSCGIAFAMARASCVQTLQSVIRYQDGRGPENTRAAGRKPGDERVIPFVESVMTVKNAAGDVLAAVNVLQHARQACAGLKPLGSPLTQAELEQRAQIIDTVVRTRKLLQVLQGRADDLEAALDRFKARREAMRA